MLWSFGFLRMGTTSLVARAAGRHDVNQTRLILAQSALLALTLGLVVALAGKLVLPLALRWVGASSEVYALAHSNASIRLRSAPAVLFTLHLVRYFIGTQSFLPP